jgi:hypothetical protein
MSASESQTELQSLLGVGDAPPTPSEGSSLSPASAARSLTFYLDGDVLACACPDCGSPMSIRLWLLVADCWRCGASVELTEEQEQEALRLLQQRETAQRPSPPAARPKEPPAAPARTVAPPEARSRPSAAPEPSVAQPPVRPTVAAAQPRVPAGVIVPQPMVVARPRAAADKPSRVRQHLDEVKQVGEVRLWFRDWFRDLPAWLTSALLHMILLILLASLWHVYEEEPRTLVLSTRVTRHDEEGAFDAPAQPDPQEFDEPGEADPKPQEEPRPEPPGPQLDPQKPPHDPGQDLGVEPFPFQAGQPGGGRGAEVFAGRTPTSRQRLAYTEGGTIESEAAVARGLEWIARHQNADGSWSLDGFHRAGDCRGRCGHRGDRSDTAATALALLPFLGAGQTHRHGQYTDVVGRGLAWLIRTQEADGHLMGDGRGAMYAHGQGAIALCEAYALTRDPQLRDPAQKAIDFIVKAQHSAGGWRYRPGQAGDTSIVGWQLMALRSAQMAYLHVPDDVFQRANRFLDSVQRDSVGGQYAYVPGQRATDAMTAEALLCRQFSGWPADHSGLVAGCRWLLDESPPSDKNFNMYYLYYATQVMHHMGGEYFARWNPRMRDLLVKTQETRGHEAGSWRPRGFHDTAGGRLYMTALAVCTLEVYYRHLPLYRQSALQP